MHGTVTLSSPANSNGLTVSLAAATLRSRYRVISGQDLTRRASASPATVAAVANAQTAILTAFYNLAGSNSPQTFS